MARSPRSDLFHPAEISAFHCIQRCVRQCFLCGRDPLTGKNFDHRKAWLEARLRFLAGCFGIDLLAFAILSNHFHLVLRNRPDVVAQWSDEEVARRWLRLCPPRKEADGSPAEPSEAELAMIVKVPSRLAEIRLRLSDISWFMRMISEPIARRANREDEVTGRFWAGRFRGVKLCDDAAILACCAYVDLNVIRAGLASTPEESDFTSIQRRIEGRVEAMSPAAEPDLPLQSQPDNWLAPVSLEEEKDEVEEPTAAQESDASSEAAPVAASKTEAKPKRRAKSSTRCSDRGFLPLSLDEYLELIDWTGRQVRPGKRGWIPASAPPILQRLGITPPDWLSLASGFGQLFARVAGRSAAATSASRTSPRRFHPGHARLLGPAPIPSSG